MRTPITAEFWQEFHVDSENLTWALQLYRGVGMKPLWHQHLFEKMLPPTEG